MNYIKVKIIGHFISPRTVNLFPWWYNRIGEIIVVEKNPFYWEVGDKFVHRDKENKNNLIAVNDIIIVNELRKRKIENIINHDK